MISRGPERDYAREITVIREALVAADEPDAVVARIAAAELVTLTITEGGYARGGMLDLLARGISDALRAADRDLVRQRAAQRRGAARPARRTGGRQLSVHGRGPDRPAPEDPLTVIAEPFSRWVIEDFDGPRPAWDAQFVEDTRPYEEMKLRLLNASHTALAALGLPKGHTTVAEAIADPELHDVRPPAARRGAPADGGRARRRGYAETMLERFANPRIEHRLEQIAAGAEHKVRQRLHSGSG